MIDDKLELVNKMERETIIQIGLNGVSKKFIERWIKCPKCGGDGIGDQKGGMEQGGYVRGVCSHCHGYAGAWEVDWSSGQEIGCQNLS
jgi:hypothetical protein